MAFSQLESASSGAVICAERASMSKAVSEGERKFKALAVGGPDTEEPVAPCGIYRQNLIEFGEEIKVIMANVRRYAEIATAVVTPPAGVQA